MRWSRARFVEPQEDELERVVAQKLAQLPAGGGPALVEDSGLFVRSLGGFPGVYSNYAFRTVGLNGLLRLVEGRPRQATFAAVIGWRAADGTTRLFRGEAEGHLSPRALGHGGFGFDPIFVPRGSRKTFAELSPEEKNRTSHRGRALDALVRALERELHRR